MITEDIIIKIQEHLDLTYTKDYFNMELGERVYDYIDSEDAKDYDDDFEEAYKNLCTGNAIEHDLISEISDEVEEMFKVDENDLYDSKIVLNHLLKNCEWNQLNETFNLNKLYSDDVIKLMNGIDDLKF